MDSTGAAEEDRFPEAYVSGQTLHTVWSASIGNNLHHLCYRRSLDGGITWQDRVIVQDYGGDDWLTMGTGNTTRLAVDGKYVHVIQLRSVPGWHYEIDYFRSTDGGATFEPKRTIADGGQYWWIQVPRIAAGGGKVAVAFYYRPNWYTSPAAHHIVSDDNGATFSGSQVLFNNSYGGSYECIDIKRTADKIISLWLVDGARVLAATSTNGGANYRVTVLSSLTTGSWSVEPSTMRPQLCAVTGDTLHTAWQQRNASGRAAFFYARSLDGGVTFETARDLSEGTIGTDEIRAGRVIMVAQGTHVYLCYVANSSGGVWLRSSADSGATFGAAKPLHLPGSGFLGNGEYPYLTLDPADATGATAWYAFAVPSGYSGASASAVGHTTDGGTTLAPLLVPAHPWAWGNFTPHNFLLLPVSSQTGTVWTMLYTGARPGYDTDLFARRFTPESGPTPGNKVLHLAPLPSSLRFDMLEVPSVPALQFSNTLTAEMWVRIDPGTRPVSLLQWGTGDDGLAFRGYPSGGSNYTLSARFRTTTGNYSVGGCPITGDGGWHHLALTYAAAAGASNLRFYVDGHLFNAVTATGTFIPIPEPLLVGGDLAGGSMLDAVAGDVDNLRLWNRALSEGEVQASSWQANLTGSESGLVAAFSFDGTVKDLSGHGADGLLQFGATYQDDLTVPTTATLHAVIAGGDLVLSWTSRTNVLYQLQSATNLPATTWFNEGAPFPGTGGVLTTNLPLGPELRKFFRLQANN